jgi:U3 small nucleolar ribonucleoprotein protein LCP5
MPMPFTEDFDKKSQAMLLSQKLKEKASHSRVLSDLKHQFDDRPEEISAEGTGYGQQDAGGSYIDQKWKERQDFEEEHFIRLNMTKQEKKIQKRMAKTGSLMRFQNEFKVRSTCLLYFFYTNCLLTTFNRIYKKILEI